MESLDGSCRVEEERETSVARMWPPHTSKTRETSAARMWPPYTRKTSDVSAKSRWPNVPFDYCPSFFIYKTNQSLESKVFL